MNGVPVNDDVNAVNGIPVNDDVNAVNGVPVNDDVNAVNGVRESLRNVRDLFTLVVEANLCSAELLTAVVHKTFFKWFEYDF